MSDHLDFVVPQSTFSRQVPTGEIVFRFRIDQSDTHVHLRVFAGQAEYSLGLAGQLVLRAEEWEALRTALARTSRVRSK